MIALAAAVVLTGAPANYHVNFPRAIGSFTYYVRGTYREAVRAFGPPSYRRTTSAVACRVGWVTKGLRIYFRSPAHPCRRHNLLSGEFSSATFVSRRWSIDRGVRVGDSFGRMRHLYPYSEQRDMFNKHRWRLRTAIAVQPGTMHKRRAFLDAFFVNRRIARIELGYQF
jgi:hypothetical protein